MTVRDKANLHKVGANEWILGEKTDALPIRYFGNDKIVDSFEENVFEQGRKTARLPDLKYLGYTPDAHVGKRDVRRYNCRLAG